MTALPASRDQFCHDMKTWPRIETASVLDDGQTLAVLVREFDGTISAVRIGVEQLAD